MRTHLACDNDLYPPMFGGTQRVFGIARGLASHGPVRALCVVPNRSSGARAETAAGVELRRVKSWHTSVAWWLERAGLAPLFSAEWGHRLRASAYRRALGSPADVLLCDLPLTGLFAGSNDGLRVYHSQNVEADRWRETAPRMLGREGWARRIEALEQRAVAESDLTVACTEADAGAFVSRYGARDVEVVANGYDETQLRPATAEARAAARRALGIAPEAYVAAFVGGDWGPNHEALGFLVDQVGPRLANEGVVLLAVGAVARRVMNRRERWLVARPETPDLAAVLAAADAGLNPVTSGGGSNVKVPSYLAMGLATVSTPFGLRGFTPLAPSVTVAERDAFADALRTRPLGWAARGEAAPAALADYAWGTLGARLGERLAARLAARGQGAA